MGGGVRGVKAQCMYDPSRDEGQLCWDEGQLCWDGGQLCWDGGQLWEWCPPAVALPVGLVRPVHALVACHERVEVEAPPQDGQAAAQLAVVDGVPHVAVTREDLPVLLQQCETHLCHGRRE